MRHPSLHVAVHAQFDLLNFGPAAPLSRPLPLPLPHWLACPVRPALLGLTSARLPTSAGRRKANLLAALLGLASIRPQFARQFSPGVAWPAPLQRYPTRLTHPSPYRRGHPPVPHSLLSLVRLPPSLLPFPQVSSFAPSLVHTPSDDSIRSFAFVSIATPSLQPL